MKEEQKWPDLKINGVGNATGGRYGAVLIDGVCKVTGDLRANTFKANGKLKVNGHLQADDMRIDGIIDINGGIGGEHLQVNGLFKASGNCELERLEAVGGFSIGGLLNAGTIDIWMQAQGKVKEIGGESIQVRRQATFRNSKLWRWMMPKLVPELHTDTIEGDDIDLENTVAGVVRGNRVTIGPGCTIGRVEYRTELHVHKTAKIGKEEKLG
ncbi:hypothetical protein [Cohnella nanjingensis]|uniref:Polymer-forming cytoskeletal protein n=1 Tax=Cohnella nanjingensis TaxID=1387779 RepID=A0A7X0VIA4_9BACL|nr:hypothetical protein [Cohnella nanjingensis]MBB6674977.1 hypothetical protein [Cohnella nanjingensis]